LVVLRLLFVVFLFFPVVPVLLVFPGLPVFLVFPVVPVLLVFPGLPVFLVFPGLPVFLVLPVAPVLFIIFFGFPLAPVFIIIPFGLVLFGTVVLFKPLFTLRHDGFHRLGSVNRVGPFLGGLVVLRAVHLNLMDQGPVEVISRVEFHGLIIIILPLAPVFLIVPLSLVGLGTVVFLKPLFTLPHDSFHGLVKVGVVGPFLGGLVVLRAVHFDVLD